MYEKNTAFSRKKQPIIEDSDWTFSASLSFRSSDVIGRLRTVPRIVRVQFDLKEGRASAADASLYAKANNPKDFAAKLAQLITAPDKRREMG